MRINRLWIEKFKNLRDFVIDFGQEEEIDSESLNTTVLIGRNGTGKSNLFEAIVLIFRNLDIGISPAFNFEITYTKNDPYDDQKLKINIRANAKANDKHHAYSIKVNNKDITLSRFFKYRRKSYLPRVVFTYYSGRNDRLELCFKTHEKKYKKNISGNIATAQRPLFYVKDEHSQFVLLSYFSHKVGKDNEDSNIKDFLKTQLDIDELDSILFTLKVPSRQETTTDENSFLGFYGNAAEYIEKIYNYSMAPIHDSETNRLYLFIKDYEQFKKLAYEFGDGKSMFQRLEALQIADCIERIDILVKKKYKDTETQVSFYDLSEGEQQLLTVLGMLRYYEDKESLFLLDEPDTHLNPKWKLEYLKLLEDAVGEKISSHIIISTHDPIMVGSLIKEQVRILKKESYSEKIISYQPHNDPRGMGVAGLLTSELFGFRSILDLHTQELLDKKRRISVKKDKTSKDLEELTELNRKLKDLDFAVFRDYTYSMFAHTISEIERRNKLDKPVLSDEERENRNKLALDVLEIIMNLGGKDL